MTRSAWVGVGAVLTGVGAGIALATGWDYGLGLLIPGLIILLPAVRWAPTWRSDDRMGAYFWATLGTGTSVFIAYKLFAGWDVPIIDSVAVVGIALGSWHGFFELWTRSRNDRVPGEAP